MINQKKIIAIDASRALHPQPTGIEIYSREIIFALLQLPESRNYQWRLLAPRLPETNDRLVNLPAHAHWEVIPGKYFWTLYYLSKYFRYNEKSFDLLFVPSHTLPIITPACSIVTIHDLAFRYYPASYGYFQARWIDHELARSVHKATQVIVPSRATANDIAQFYGTPTNQLQVIPHGINHQTLDIVKSGDFLINDSKEILKKEPYFVVIGRIEPRKNSLGISQAYQQAVNLQPDLPNLVFIGRPGRGGQELIKKIKSLPAFQVGKILLLGYQSFPITHELLRQSQGLIFPSLYEGFGFTILEGMAAGVPVLTSTTSSLPEAAGQAALTVDPTNLKAIAEGIIRLATDKILRMRLIKAGTARASKFTWQKAARATFQVLVKSLR